MAAAGLAWDQSVSRNIWRRSFHDKPSSIPKPAVSCSANGGKESGHPLELLGQIIDTAVAQGGMYLPHRLAARAFSPSPGCIYE